MSNKELNSPKGWVTKVSGKNYRFLLLGRFLSGGLLLAAVVLLVYGLIWNYSTRRYLKGFSEAIVPLQGSPEEKTKALLGWLRDEPARKDTSTEGSPRDPVGVVQHARLLKICGSASNAFANLAEAAGLKTRRLLLLDPSGGTKHVVVEVEWTKRWVVVDPSFRSIFEDQTGRALTKEDLRNPEIFRDAISRIPNYQPIYTFDRTGHIHLARIPALGYFLGRVLKFLFPRWEEMANWGYLPDHPSLWPIVISLPLFLLGILIRLIVRRRREQLGIKTVGFRKRLMVTGRVFLQKSA
jgi:hypothetical protein